MDVIRIDRIPVWFLLINNAVPFFGILFLGWRVFDAAFILVVDVAVLGLFSLIKIIFIKNSAVKPYLQKVTVKSSAYGIGASTSDVKQEERRITNPVHIKMNAMAVVAFGLIMGVVSITLALLDKLGVEFDFSILLFCIAPFVNHLVSFVKNYVLGMEYESSQPMDIGNIFMARLGIMILTIGFGLMLGKWGLLLVVLIFKTFADYKLHMKEHDLVYTGHQKHLD